MDEDVTEVRIYRFEGSHGAARAMDLACGVARASVLAHAFALHDAAERTVTVAAEDGPDLEDLLEAGAIAWVASTDVMDADHPHHPVDAADMRADGIGEWEWEDLRDADVEAGPAAGGPAPETLSLPR